MKGIKVNPGDVVVTKFGLYEHWSLVSDRVCERGKPMLISATQRNGTVQEESWDKTTENKPTSVVSIGSIKETVDVLRDARSMIGEWQYSLTSQNCEHFVKWALGLKVESVQVKNVVAAGLFGLAMAYIFKRPKLVTTALVAGVALASTTALNKSSAESLNEY